MSRYLYRKLYKVLATRASRVTALNVLRGLKLPYYRLGIDTNNLCNVRCIMCYLSLEGFQPKPVIMPLGRFESLARELFPRVKFLDLSCGFEPFMTRNFLDYVRIARAHSKGILSVATNGLLLTPQIIDKIFMAGLLDEIIISLDGLSRENYEAIRVRGDFQHLLEVLDWLKQAKTQYPQAVSLRINYTMMARNVEELLGMYDFARKYEIDVVQLRHVRLSVEFKHLFPESLYFHQELANRILTQVARDFAADPKLTLLAPPLFSQEASHRGAKARCAYPWFSFNIYSNGDVQMCDIGIVGNIMDRSFSQVENSPRVREIRRRLLKGDCADICHNCLYFTEVLDVNDPASFIREDVSVMSQLQPEGRNVASPTSLM